MTITKAEAIRQVLRENVLMDARDVCAKVLSKYKIKVNVGYVYSLRSTLYKEERTEMVTKALNNDPVLGAPVTITGGNRVPDVDPDLVEILDKVATEFGLRQIRQYIVARTK